MLRGTEAGMAGEYHAGVCDKTLLSLSHTDHPPC